MQRWRDSAKRCLWGSLLAVRGAYFPILVRDSHWVGAAIVPGEKRIVVYDPNGEGLDAKNLANHLLRLVVDEFKREGNSNREEIEILKSYSSLVDMSSRYPKQENGKSVQINCLFQLIDHAANC